MSDNKTGLELLGELSLGEDFSVEIISSTKEFHSPQEEQRPTHLGDWIPQL
jgi:hypothetical protein